MDKPDNGYEKDEKGGYRQINNDGGDEIDYLYENGEIVESKEVQTYSGETISGSGIGNKARDYGKIWIGQSPALYDPSFDIAATSIPLGRGLKISGKIIDKVLTSRPFKKYVFNLATTNKGGQVISLFNTFKYVGKRSSTTSVRGGYSRSLKIRWKGKDRHILDW